MTVCANPDKMIAVIGVLLDTDGVVAALGTCSVFTRLVGGTVRIIRGRGLILGDEGSGAWLGGALLLANLKATDGLCAMTALIGSILGGLDGTNGVIGFAFSARPLDIASCEGRIVGSDDPAAKSLMDEADADIDASIRERQPGPFLPMVFLGGLGLSIAPRFADRWNIRLALCSGLGGALWWALRVESPA